MNRCDCVIGTTWWCLMNWWLRIGLWWCFDVIITLLGPFPKQFQKRLFALTNHFLAFIELDMKSSQVVTLFFLEQNQHFISSFSLICPVFTAFMNPFLGLNPVMQLYQLLK